MHLAGNPGFAEETTAVIEQSSISAALMTPGACARRNDVQLSGIGLIRTVRLP
jgi:hypothetical protein